MSLIQRKIDLTFRLGKGSFGNGGANTVKISGLRCWASVSKAGGVSMSSLNLRVEGMSLSIMNQLSTLGKPLVDGRNNTVTVEAGDDEAGMGVVFVGTIFQAWADLNNAPDAVFTVEAHTGLLDALRPLPPTSVKGSADVALLMSGLAQQMGYAFENSGVDTRVASPYLPGTGRQQALALAQAAGIEVLFDDNTLAIWPRGASRTGATILLNKDTGLVGYPTWTANGVVLKSQFNPSVTFGAQVKVESIIKPACGTWTIFKVQHDLAAEAPDGPWFTAMEATVLGHAVIPQ